MAKSRPGAKAIGAKTGRMPKGLRYWGDGRADDPAKEAYSDHLAKQRARDKKRGQHADTRLHDGRVTGFAALRLGGCVTLSMESEFFDVLFTALKLVVVQKHPEVLTPKDMWIALRILDALTPSKKDR